MTDVTMSIVNDETVSSAEFAGISSYARDTSSWPWVEKYRPSRMDDIIAHKGIVSTINQLVEKQKLPHLLFYGPPGTGKTSMIIAIARKIYGKHFSSMVLELNASDDRGIDVVRNQIKEFAGTKKLFSSGAKLIILDEADSMTNDAQFSLRRVIEKYTKHTRFCLICNYVSKIIPALQSRCMRFRFAPLGVTQVGDRVKQIRDLEKIDLTDGGFDALMQLGKGDMRRILNILQAASLAYATVNEENVYLCTGNPVPEDIAAICHSLWNDSFAEAVSKCQAIQMTKGYATTDIMKEVYHNTTEVDLPAKCQHFIYDELAKLEHRLATGASEKLQLISLVSIYFMARGLLASDGTSD
uniref:Replication factor C subunit 5 putative n=1 Tax=Albugo laibachii Nc14 TaxID=890382 RepID=F0WII3_9STRA|nr:replication factor C subunit 5 putative [Albugo laibachii Nc14]|eukprot:CCA21065.1 replication factor C subunit 5 putative [Albugo laibachii Nc14]